MAKSKGKLSRPKIPPNVKLELWAKAGGRCQFRGCNKPIWHDKVTMATLNLSNIAHIVSWTSTGPRGHVTRSALLGKDIKNLMLTCREHNGVIDNDAYVDQYPESLLLEFKHEHEERIEIVTSINHSSKSELLLLKANIGNNAVDIDEKQAQIASLPMYPSKMRPCTIDLTTLSSDAPDYWTSGFNQIEKRIQNFFDRDVSYDNATHVSVFALGPIPFLVKLGKCLGDKIPMRLFQRHRDTQDWNWKNEIEHRFSYIVNRYQRGQSVTDVGIVFSLSGKIHEDEFILHLGSNFEVIEVTIPNPNPGFLRQEINLFDFRKVYRDLLSELRSKYGQAVRVHIFPAVPAPVAVELGRGLLPKVDPDISIYDKQKDVSNNFILRGKI